MDPHSSRRDGLLITPTGEAVLPSKFAVPTIRGPLIHRLRLLDLLDAGVQGPLTLISASAGTGKSLLAAQWTESGRAPGTVVWLTLDAADDEPGRFWFYLREALTHCGVMLAGSAQPADATGTDRSLLAGFAAGLADLQRPVIVVLDEFDAISDGRIREGLEFVSRHAGSALRLVLLTRRDPVLRLHRYRVRGDLAEIRAADLALTTNESARLLRSHGISLTRDALNALQQRTEGWVTGLCLVVLALAGRPDPERFVAEFAADETAIADYLVGEVLQVQSPETRDLLLRTSLLERVHPDLANALTGRSDGRRTLAALEHDNAFVALVSGTHEWYRYHRLLRDVLRVEIAFEAPDLVPDLHLRAARWLAAAGRLPEAVAHAAAGGDLRAAAGLVVDDLAVGALFVPPDGRLATALAREGADSDGPESAAIAAALALAARDFPGAADRLREAESRTDEVPLQRIPALRLATALLHAELARGVGDADGVLTAVHQMDDLSARLNGDRLARHPEIPSLARAAEGSALLWLGRLDEAESALTEGVTTATGPQARYPRLDLLGQLAAIEAVRGHLRRADELAHEVIADFDETGLAARHRISTAHLALAWSATDRNDLAVARRHLDLAARGAGAAEPAVKASLALVRARLLRSSGDLAGALDAVAGGRAVAGDWTRDHALPAWLDSQLTALEADLHVARGDPETALVTLKRATDSEPRCAAAWARAWLAVDDLSTAQRVLRAALARSGSQRPPVPVLVELWLLRGQAAALSGDRAAAARSVQRAWRMAQPEQLRRPFLEAGPWLRSLFRSERALGPVRQWLSPRRARPAPSVPQQRQPEVTEAPLLVDTLSARERQVLRLLAEMLSTDEIATQMCVSRNTVKTHLRNLYRKLSASRRSEAVRRARTLGVL